MEPELEFKSFHFILWVCVLVVSKVPKSWQQEAMLENNTSSLLLLLFLQTPNQDMPAAVFALYQEMRDSR